MTVGSLFAGAGGFDLGFTRAGFDLRWQVEIDADCLAVLTRQWPTVRKVRDIHALAYGRAKNRARHGLTLEPVDVIVGGFPCQDLSVAGQRAGLQGSRSGLFFALMRVVRLLKPEVVVVENVPGLFSLAQGRDFARVLHGLDECGYVGAWRVLDSQYFGVAQRRRRVFLVACARASRVDPAAVLFESVGRQGDSAAGGEAGADVAATLRGRAHGAGVNAPGRGGEDDVNLVFTVQGEHSCAMTGNGEAAVARCVDTVRSLDTTGGYATNQGGTVVAYTLGTNERNKSQGPANYVVGVHANQRGEVRTSPLAGSLNGSRSAKQFEGVQVGYAPSCLTANNTRHSQNENQPLVTVGVDQSHALTTTHTRSGRYDRNGETYVSSRMSVRRLTPLECERLQAFPDGWTCLCGTGHRGSQFCICPDTPRYRMLGNAVTVSVSTWIAQRIVANWKKISDE